MTTRIHIVNFGPDKVAVETQKNVLPQYIYQDSYADFYVYPGQDVHVTEVKEEIPKTV